MEKFIINKTFENFISDPKNLNIINDIEFKRKHLLAKFKKYIFIILSIGFFVNIIFYSTNFFVIANIFYGVLSFIFLLTAYLILYPDYNQFYKQSFIHLILSFFSNDIVYKPKDFIDKRDFKKSELFPRHFIDYNGDDFVSCKIGETEISFSEL